MQAAWAGGRRKRSAGVVDAASVAGGEMGEDLLDDIGNLDARDDAQTYSSRVARRRGRHENRTVGRSGAAEAENAVKGTSEAREIRVPREPMLAVAHDFHRHVA